jgi:hypothetical protein
VQNYCKPISLLKCTEFGRCPQRIALPPSPSDGAVTARSRVLCGLSNHISFVWRSLAMYEYVQGFFQSRLLQQITLYYLYIQIRRSVGVVGVVYCPFERLAALTSDIGEWNTKPVYYFWTILHSFETSYTWTVLEMTAAKFKPLVFSMLGFALYNAANIFIFVIWDVFCSLSSWLCCAIVNLRNLERLAQPRPHPLCSGTSERWTGLAQHGLQWSGDARLITIQIKLI